MEKQRWEESGRREVKKWEDKRWRKSKREDAGARKGRKVANHCVFQWFGAPEARKVTSLYKAAGTEPAGQMRDGKLPAVVARSTFPSQNVQNTPFSNHFWKLRYQKSACCCSAKHISNSKCTKHTMLGPLLEVAMSKKCTPLWREAHFQVKRYKTRHSRTTFGSCDVKKVHAVVARSTFPTQNVPFSDHFWKLQCRKSAHRCGAKHICKSKCTKHTIFGPLSEVAMSKKCTLLWREAHFQLKVCKTHHSGTTFGSCDVEKVHAVISKSKCTKHTILEPLLEVAMSKSARSCGAKHISNAKCTILGPLLEVAMSKKCTPLWREAHCQIESVKKWGVRTTFGVWRQSG